MLSVCVLDGGDLQWQKNNIMKCDNHAILCGWEQRPATRNGFLHIFWVHKFFKRQKKLQTQRPHARSCRRDYIVGLIFCWLCHSNKRVSIYNLARWQTICFIQEIAERTHPTNIETVLYGCRPLKKYWVLLKIFGHLIRTVRLKCTFHECQPFPWKFPN